MLAVWCWFLLMDVSISLTASSIRGTTNYKLGTQGQIQANVTDALAIESEGDGRSAAATLQLAVHPAQDIACILGE